MLIIRAPTGSGKTTIYPALAARSLPKRLGRGCCTQVRRAKKQRKKQSKEGDVPPSGEGEDSDEEEAEEKPEGESKEKPDGESKEEGDKPTTEEKKSEDKEKSEEKPKPEGEETTEKPEEGPPKDKEPEDSWAEVLKRARKPRQVKSKAAEQAKARSYPRPMCELSAKPNYTYPRPQHVPTRETMYSGKWIVNEKPKDVQKRSVLKLTKEHIPIWENGVRSRYTDYKVCVLQAMNARKQTPRRGTPFTLQGADTNWVQTTLQLHEDGSLPFSELPGMYPRLYTFDKFWDIPRRKEGRQLEGVALGVAQYVVGTFELDMKRRAATVKAYVDNEPFWLNMEAFKEARVLIKEISGFYHQQDMGVLEWSHAFVYHPAEINPTRALQERFPKANAGRWVHVSALVEHLCSVQQEGFNSLPFHTRGSVRMVPKEHWAAMFILASLMEPGFHIACDEHGFIWVRTCVCDIKRPNPSFPETEVEDPVSKETSHVKGDGNIDFRGDITSHPFGYIVCTLLEIHEAFDTLVVRRGTASTDTFVCFTSRYPDIFFQKNKVPRTNKLVVVKFDMWTAFRAGAMAYRNSANQWILTTGLPLESIVMVRDHLGNCFDMSTMTMMEWKFLPTTNDEPETLSDLLQKECVMPTCERWHCVLTEKEKATSTGIHLLDWQPYHKSWGDEYLSMRHADTNPPEKPLTLAEWVGSKVWQVAVISPMQPEEPQETVKWWYNPSGLNYLSGQGTRDDDRSRTPLRKGKGRGDPNDLDPKGKGLGKKGKKPAKIIGSPEGEELERVGRKFFPATLPESWREKKPEEIVVSGSIEERPGQGGGTLGLAASTRPPPGNGPPAVLMLASCLHLWAVLVWLLPALLRCLSLGYVIGMFNNSCSILPSFIGFHFCVLLSLGVSSCSAMLGLSYFSLFSLRRGC